MSFKLSFFYFGREFVLYLWDNKNEMRFLRHIIILTVVFTAVALVSCKKDDDNTTTKEYLNGTITFDFPSYVYYGDVVHVVPTGVYRKDESDTLLAFSWKNPLTELIDTLRHEGDPDTESKEFDFVVSLDTLGSFSLTVSAWADGYYTKTTTVSFVIVDPKPESGSIKGYGSLNFTPRFNDARDGQLYYYTTVDGKDWMIQNLAWNGAGMAYSQADALSPVFGRYYTWDEAQTACPSGWHLPSSAEFKALAETAGGKEATAAGSLMMNATFNGSRMWEFWPEVTITNSTRFSAIPAGYVVMEDETPYFKGFNNYALFWTSDAVDTDMAVARYIYVDKPELYAGEFGKKSLRASVRCVK